MAGVQKTSQFPQASSASPADEVPLLQSGVLKRVTVAKLTGSPDNGWQATGESWTFSSYSSTTNIGVVTVPSDATTKYGIGMFVRVQQTTGGIKYGMIIGVTSTTLTIWFRGYTLNNEAITSPVYSTVENPVGLPIKIAEGNPYDFSVWRNGALNTSSIYPVYDTEEFDNTNNYNTANGRFTAPVDGTYLFNYGAIIASPGMGPSHTGIDKNGGEHKRCTEVPSMASGNNTVSGTSFVKMVAGDYVNVRISTAAVSNLVVGNQAYNWFNGSLHSRN